VGLQGGIGPGADGVAAPLATGGYGQKGNAKSMGRNPLRRPRPSQDPRLAMVLPRNELKNLVESGR
jgi:hypothetical protein